MGPLRRYPYSKSGSLNIRQSDTKGRVVVNGNTKVSVLALVNYEEFPKYRGPPLDTDDWDPEGLSTPELTKTNIRYFRPKGNMALSHTKGIRGWER
jgi:hypothetical protein